MDYVHTYIYTLSYMVGAMLTHKMAQNVGFPEMTALLELFYRRVKNMHVIIT